MTSGHLPTEIRAGRASQGARCRLAGGGLGKRCRGLLGLKRDVIIGPNSEDLQLGLQRDTDIGAKTCG